MKIKNRQKYLIAIISGMGLLLLAFGLSRISEKPKAIVQYDPESFKNITYFFDRGPIKLSRGEYVVKDAKMGVVMSVKYFGNELREDLNHDGLTDVVFILVENTGGNGFFYHAVGAIATPAGYIGTNTVFLGDRISPNTINYIDGLVAVNYAERSVGDPVTTKPSVGVSKYLLLVGNQLVAINKEGEPTFKINNPRDGVRITSPLMVSGSVSGTWFFEGSFGVTLIDDNGEILASAPATASGEWMTTKPVDFSSSLVFEKPKTEHGSLIFQKDNPSGLDIYDKAVLVPVIFR